MNEDEQEQEHEEQQEEDQDQEECDIGIDRDSGGGGGMPVPESESESESESAELPLGAEAAAAADDDAHGMPGQHDANDALAQLQAEMEAMEDHALAQEAAGRKVGARHRTWYTMPGKHQFYVSEQALPLATNLRTSLPLSATPLGNGAGGASRSHSAGGAGGGGGGAAFHSHHNRRPSLGSSFGSSSFGNNSAVDAFGGAGMMAGMMQTSASVSTDLSLSGKAHVAMVGGKNRISEVPHIRQHSFAPRTSAGSATLERKRVLSAARRRAPDFDHYNHHHKLAVEAAGVGTIDGGGGGGGGFALVQSESAPVFVGKGF
jgi:hypothetical protein